MEVEPSVLGRERKDYNKMVLQALRGYLTHYSGLVYYLLDTFCGDLRSEGELDIFADCRARHSASLVPASRRSYWNI